MLKINQKALNKSLQKAIDSAVQYTIEDGAIDEIVVEALNSKEIKGVIKKSLLKALKLNPASIDAVATKALIKLATS